MKTIIKKCFPIALLLCLSTAAFADDGGGSIPHFLNFFSVPATDESYALLGMLFGGMGDVLPGAPNIMGALFAKFNASMLVLATLVFLYTMLNGLVTTAHEGEFLGKKFHSVWTPLRVVGGIGLLVPLKSGYCILQVVLMWCVIQGIGAADTLWASAITFLDTHALYNQANFQSQQNTGDDPNNPASTQSGSFGYVMGQAVRVTQSLFTSYVCSYETYKNAGGTDKDIALGDPIKSGNNFVYQFPSYVGGDSGPVKGNPVGCGQMIVPIVGTVNNINDAATKAAGNAMGDVLGVLSDAGRQYAYHVASSDQKNIDSVVTGYPLTAAQEYFADHVTQATSAYISKNPSSNSNQDDPNSDSAHARSMLNSSVKYGWIYAGAYYKQLGMTSPAMANTQAFEQFDWKNQPNTNVSGYTVQPTTDQMGELSKTAKDGSSGNSIGSQYIDTNELPGQLKPLSGVFDLLVGGITTVFVDNLSAYNSNDKAVTFASGTDPVIGLQVMGRQMTNLVAQSWNDMLAVVISFIILAVFLPCLQPLFAVVMKIFGFFVMIFTMFYAVGLSMSTYIPMVPYIIFLFGGIGWMTAVVETMLAAPIVAIGIVYPEGGHDLLGRAAPAGMLVTNVFLRPTFMIFGLIVGMLLSYIGVLLLNSAYEFVVYSNSAMGVKDTQGNVPPIGAFEWAMYMIIYVSIVMVIVNKSFSLIHSLPDNILRWIGGQAGFGEYSKGAEQVGDKVTSASNQVGQTVGSSASGLASGGDTLSKGAADLGKSMGNPL